MTKRTIVHNDYGFSISLDDPDPMTRYAPPEQTAWEKVREAWRLGWARYKGGSAHDD